MTRVAFRLRLRPGSVETYEKAHRQVWPEMLQLLKSVGIEQYSIFRQGLDLFFYMRVDNFERAWGELDRSPVNQRWQEEMAPFFQPIEGLQSGERFPMMREVFYLE